MGARAAGPHREEGAWQDLRMRVVPIAGKYAPAFRPHAKQRVAAANDFFGGGFPKRLPLRRFSFAGIRWHVRCKRTRTPMKTSLNLLVVVLAVFVPAALLLPGAGFAFPEPLNALNAVIGLSMAFLFLTLCADYRGQARRRPAVRSARGKAAHPLAA